MRTTSPQRSAAVVRRPLRQPIRPEGLERRQLLSGLTATYYDNPDFTGTSVTRIDANVNFNWGSGSPDALIAADSFSARWVGQVRAAYSEEYTFYVTANDGARLWVNGQLLVDRWADGDNTASGAITLEAGGLYDVRLEYRENAGSARVQLSWRSARQAFGVINTSMLYPPSTPATPAPNLVGETPGIVNARSHGAVGNGVTDDSAALQRAIDATPTFGTLRLEPRTYKLNKGLVIHRPMNLEGNGGLLLLNTSTYPHNHQLVIDSTLTGTPVEWTEQVVAGQSTFHPALPAGTFAVGQWVFLELGQDPNDPNEQHFTAVVPVTAISGNGITLGTTVPHNIVNGTRRHRITAVESLATQVHVRDVKFDHVDGTIPNTAIWMGLARNSSVDGVSGRANILANIADSTSVSLRNASVTVSNGHGAAGRVATLWQSNYVNISDVVADTSFDKALFFVESWSRNTTISNVDVRWRYAASPTHAIFHLTGGSSGTYAHNVRIDNDGAVMLAGSGAQSGQYQFGTVSIRRSTGTTASLTSVTDLTVGARRYAAPLRLTRVIDLAGGWRDQRFGLMSGTVKSVKLSVTHANSVSGVYVLNATGQGAGAPSLTPGVTVSPWQLGMLGPAYPFNDAAESLKSLVVYTPAAIPAGAKLIVDIEYYPSQR